MKRKYLIILIVFVLLGIIIFLGYNIYNYINYVPSSELLEDSGFITNCILENEKKDDNLETFIATSEISTIDNEKNTEFYAIVLIDTYNIENQLLEHNQSITKLYKIIFKNGKVISSDSINVEDIDSYDDYSIFPKDIIIKCQQMKNSVDLKNYLTQKINQKIDDYYYEINKQNWINKD